MQQFPFKTETYKVMRNQIHLYGVSDLCMVCQTSYLLVLYIPYCTSWVKTWGEPRLKWQLCTWDSKAWQTSPAQYIQLYICIDGGTQLLYMYLQLLFIPVKNWYDPSHFQFYPIWPIWPVTFIGVPSLITWNWGFRMSGRDHIWCPDMSEWFDDVKNIIKHALFWICCWVILVTWVILNNKIILCRIVVPLRASWSPQSPSSLIKFSS